MLTADPKAAFLAHEPALRAAIDRVLASGRYILGQEVASFEAEFTQYLGATGCVSVANGTEALEIALRAAGVRPGSRVLTVANTVSATIAAIEQIGAIPDFVDIDPQDLLLSTAALEKRLATDAKDIAAVIPVHLYGAMADMPGILRLCEPKGIPVIEDCAQAHGASLHGRRAGTWGLAAAFSFYPTKNLGALGDGGAVVSSDPALLERARLLRQYGWRERYVSEMPGRNSRLDELQAAILRERLQYLDTENSRRAANVARISAVLPSVPGSPALQRPRADCVPVWHQCAILSPHREALRLHLQGHGIHAAVLYPVPAHRQQAYLRPGLQLPVTERACTEVLCLPCHPFLTESDLSRLGEALLDFRC